MGLPGPLSEALSGTAGISALAALAWGLDTIWTRPCHLAGVPLMVGYLAVTPEPGNRQGGRRRRLVILACDLGGLFSLAPLGALDSRVYPWGRGHSPSEAEARR